LLPSDEPPGADPHAWWCGRGPVKTGPYPDGIVLLRVVGRCYVRILPFSFGLLQQTIVFKFVDDKCSARAEWIVEDRFCLPGLIR